MGQRKFMKMIDLNGIEKIRGFWITILFALFVLMGCKQNEKQAKDITSTDTMELGQDSATTDEVQHAVMAFNIAMVDPTVELMEALCAEELTYGHSSGLIQDRAAFIDDIVNGPFNFLSVEAPDQTIHISGNTVIVRHIFLARATNEGEPVDIRIGNVQVYQKGKDSKLRLLARQAYKLPN
ncbi:nuclear transport factor 2 family protein [Arenibacter sp. F26102]|uniref:nuclear transport factor 2 family protein n=1 Tax=Arenibacter sp. F26102 TaxID=2926416 RepID=UPI001FF40A17|nr:nuclear transport factor 2 family protein [Arenibacter sp. F26102]MCK0147656.1 nuclear transport factor 2 family protein [Arenibacter sp. F26102]